MNAKRSSVERGRPAAEAPATAGLPSVLLAISSRTALRGGLGAAFGLALLGLLARLAWYDGGAPPGLYSLVDVDSERSLPAWFSSVLLATCAASLWTVGGMVRTAGRRVHLPWWLLAFVFLYLSVDEYLSIHERASEPVRSALGLGGALHYAWVLVAVPLVVLLALVLLPFLRALPRRTLLAFLVAGAVYVGGAVGMEMVAGLLGSRGEQGSTSWHVLVTLEELGEMAGAALLLAAVHDHRERHVGRVGLVGRVAARG